MNIFFTVFLKIECKLLIIFDYKWENIIVRLFWLSWFSGMRFKVPCGFELQQSKLQAFGSWPIFLRKAKEKRYSKRNCWVELSVARYSFKNPYEIIGNALLAKIVRSLVFEISFLSKCKSQTTTIDEGISTLSGYDDFTISIHVS